MPDYDPVWSPHGQAGLQHAACSDRSGDVHPLSESVTARVWLTESFAYMLARTC
jgi:hypothetical protein